MIFFTSVFEPELLLLWPKLWVSKLKSKVSIPEHGLNTRKSELSRDKITGRMARAPQQRVERKQRFILSSVQQHHRNYGSSILS
jgi:hypothetical protein